jgi:serine/threonine-protein kinase
MSSVGQPSPTSATGSAPDEILPRKFGKYTLMRKLATGGMAELYLAIHRSISGFEKLVVIKQILPRFTADPEFVQMFMDEARIAATLSHPNIIQIFDVGAVGDRYFIAMEFIHGEDVRSIVRGMVAKQLREFPLEHALAVTIGICAGLDYAHSRKGFAGEDLNIVHRDISPQNILVTFTGDVKLVDFGIAKAALKSRAEGAPGSAKPDEGQLRGKFPYMSPEQCRGLALDHRSDIFSLGIVLFELTTGRRLFRGKNEVDTIRRIIEEPYPQPTKIRPGYPPALEPIVMRALSRERDARYGSARELQADLERFVRDERVPVSSIALSNFMHELFADKLAAQRQAMAEGKQLADVIASENAGEEIRFDDVADTAVTGRTAGPRSTTRSMVVVQPKRSRAGLWVGVGLACAALIGGGLWFAFGRGGGEAAAPVDAGLPAPPDVAQAPPDTAPERDTFVAAVDTAPAPQIKKGTLLFSGVPSGMKVFLDDQFALDNRNPGAGDFPISRVAAGDHVLRLEHPEYVADPIPLALAEEQLAPVGGYGDGWTIDLVANYVRPLAEGEVWLTLTLVEPGAELKINDEGPIAYQPEVPLRRRAKLVDGEIRIEVTKRYFEAFRRTYRPLQGQPDAVTVETPIALTRSAGTGPRDAGTVTPPPTGTGRLAVRCDPYATVTIQGHGSRGTPFSMELPAGTYRLTFANPDQGLSGSTTVTITPGGNTKVMSCW